jgi:uncharacterized protein YndB with AHSA1/START domain
MSPRSVVHSSFLVERTYGKVPAVVFAAWAEPSAKVQWFAGPDDWQQEDHVLDFRVGGQEHAGGGPKGGPLHRYDATYLDIVPDERIVSTYEMHMDASLMSVSVATVEFQPDGSGTRLIYTEQGAFLDELDNAQERERGTRGLLDQLEEYLRQPARR